MAVGVFDEAHQNNRVLAGARLVSQLVASQSLILTIDIIVLVHWKALQLHGGIVLGCHVGESYFGVVLNDLLGLTGLEKHEC